MSEVKWTKGPWRVTSDHFVDAPIGGGLLQEVAWCGDVEKGSRQANASLISAAPDLYEALDKILRTWAVSQNDRVKGEAALAKARGEQP